MPRTEKYTRRDSFGRTIEVTRNIDTGEVTKTAVVDTSGHAGIRPPADAYVQAQLTSQPAEPGTPPDAKPAGTVLRPPAGNASTEDWVAFARTMGVEVAEDAKRADIQAALKAANITLGDES